MIDHCLPTRGIGLAGVARTLRATGGIGVSPSQQPLHARRRGRIIREEIFEKLPDGLEKPPPPPPPDFGEVVHTPVDIFDDFKPSQTNIVFKGLDNVEAIKARQLEVLRAEREEDDIEAIALILSELD